MNAKPMTFAGTRIYASLSLFCSFSSSFIPLPQQAAKQKKTIKKRHVAKNRTVIVKSVVLFPKDTSMPSFFDIIISQPSLIVDMFFQSFLCTPKIGNKHFNAANYYPNSSKIRG